MAQANQGQGFATEALTCLLDHLFRHMRLHRVVADADPRNTASWTLLERLGMRREGNLRQSLMFKGQWVDEYLYAILAEEWLARPDQPACRGNQGVTLPTRLGIDGARSLRKVHRASVVTAKE